MLSKRVLFPSILFLLLLVILILASPFVQIGIRRDVIPPGAYLIPWMRPSASVDSLYNSLYYQNRSWNVETVMPKALGLSVIFNIGLPNGTRRVSTSVYLGHDADFLYVGGVFRGIYSNPTSNGPMRFPDYFDILMDVKNDGALLSPEAGSYASILITQNNTAGLWQYYDETWKGDIRRVVSGQVVYGAWTLAQLTCNQPFSTGGIVMEYVPMNGTLEMLFLRHLNMPGSCANSFQMRAGERWVMGFVLEAGYGNGNPAPPPADPWQDFVDGWPRNVYPYLTSDASWWPKMVIDLANPPTGFIAAAKS